MNKKLILALLPFMLLTGCGQKEEPQPEGPVDNGKIDYVFLAQPAVAAVMSQKSNVQMYENVQNAYKEKSNNLEITQASIFVRNDADNTKINAFLAMIKNEVSTLMDDPQTVLPAATQGLEEQVINGKIGGKVQLISNLLKNGNSIGLGYKEAYGNKAAIDAFIGTIGLPESNESIYFQTSNAIPAASSLDLKVAVPSGAPAIAFYNHFKETNLEVGGADTIVAYLSNSSDKDVVVVPTNAGISSINQGVNYKIAATITFGNFFLLSTGNDDDGILNKGDKVVAFQEKGVPGKIFKYLYGDKELDVEFLADAAAVKDKVLTEK